MPPALEDLGVPRVVVRNGFSRDLASLLLRDLGRAVARLSKNGGAPSDEVRGSFHH
jgi:glutamate decarboxylase